MKATYRCRLPNSFCLAVILTVSVNAQQISSKTEDTPRGNWTVMFETYRGPGYSEMPVKLLTQKVTGSGNGFIIVTNYELQNTSEKDVRSADFAAFIYDEKYPEKLLLIRKVLTVGFTTGISAGSNWRPVKTNAHWHNFAFTRDGLISPLLKNGALEGNYRIAIGITKVEFTDDSEWKFKPSEPASQTKNPANR